MNRHPFVIRTQILFFVSACDVVVNGVVTSGVVCIPILFFVIVFIIVRVLVRFSGVGVVWKWYHGYLLYSSTQVLPLQ